MKGKKETERKQMKIQAADDVLLEFITTAYAAHTGGRYRPDTGSR